MIYNLFMWNERYSNPEFAYGTEPNTFLRDNAHLLSGPVLSLAEGEGRNSVYLATLGFDVLGVDSSSVGLEKAHLLSISRGVRIKTEVVDLAVFEPPNDIFRSVISIFCHLPTTIRSLLHSRIAAALMPGGIVLLEAYTPAQTVRQTGGPREPDLCPSASDLRTEFPGFEFDRLMELEREVVEGRYHTGWASVVQVIARKPGSVMYPSADIHGRW